MAVDSQTDRYGQLQCQPYQERIYYRKPPPDAIA